jgi:predicted helicase
MRLMFEFDNIFINYIQGISKKFSYHETSEMGYRADFEVLLKEVFSSINIYRFDHDAKARQRNKPDFVVIKDEVPILYIETKDIGVNLDKVEKSDQMSRYYGYANLVLTDYVEFRFYRNGMAYGEPVKIGRYDLKGRTIEGDESKFELLARTLVDFTLSHREPIKTGKHLSKIMAGKAQRIRDNIREYLKIESDRNMELVRVYETIKKLLVHDLSKSSFADMYAQTLVYGLFVARYYDETPDDFSRQEARDLIPKSNPLLMEFFDHIVGPKFDKRLEIIVNELCEVFAHADVEELMKQYFQGDLWGGEHSGPDPVIHFYEDFLKEYDPDLRKKMGAYYTPLPVVRFITRSVDYLLRKEFGLVNGLADTARLASGKHKVQVLDPAVGTGTFIGAVIFMIYESLVKRGQKGAWPTYVHHDLLPRIHGFELMMAPYTIAHLKLGMAFRQTGFKYFHRRLGIYLTNSLEDIPKQEELFTAFGLADSIAKESKEASVIKNQTPIMVVLGNPPYSGETSNVHYKGNDVYKVEPVGGKLQERNSKWLNDDYVKFIRLAESMVEKIGEGIVAMITAHGYIDNPTFRGMRWHLMKSFDEIYVLDLHGNANKKETAPDGGEDKNVFNIKTGVAILFGIKKRDSKSDLARIYKADLYGKRSIKFKYLDENLISSVKWEQLNSIAPNYEWVARDEKKFNRYDKGFSIDDLFLLSSVGVVTSRDEFVIDMDRHELGKRIQNFLYCQSPEVAKARFNLKENKKWRVADALKHEFDESNIVPISYRPFDTRYIYYHDDFIERSRREVMKGFFDYENIGLVTARSNKNPNNDHFWVSKYLTEAKLGESSTQSAVFPLYLNSKDGESNSNLKQEIVEVIESVVGKVTPEELFDYVYAVLHSPGYREKYKEFLKIDFPRVPYPKDKKSFKKLVRFGSELRGLHLLESPKVNKFLTIYPVSGSNVVEKRPEFVDGPSTGSGQGRVYINGDQYFGKVPEAAWNFWIGGYQPARKWLKDRKGRKLTNADIEHYQKMIVTLTETERIMKKIDDLFGLIESGQKIVNGGV